MGGRVQRKPVPFVPAFRRSVSCAIMTLVAALCFVALPAQSARAPLASGAWRVAPVPTPTGHWYAVDYVGGKWIALGNTAHVAVSSNGSTWSEHFAPAGSWQSVTYGNGKLVALSSVNASPHEMFSTNGVNWTPVSGPTGAWTGLTFGAGRFVGVSSLGQLTTSTDWVH